LLPTSIFLLELLVAVLIYEESERRRDRQEGWRAVVLAAFLLVVMPLFSLATQLAVGPDAPELFPMFLARTTGLVLLALVLHGTVLMSGRIIRESRGWWSFTAQSGRWRVRAWLLRRRDQKVTAAALSSFIIYRRLYTRHRTAWPGDLPEFGPWDGVARLIIGPDLAASSPLDEVSEVSRMLSGAGGLPSQAPGTNGGQVGMHV
jgi:hypothetical protein